VNPATIQVWEDNVFTFFHLSDIHIGKRLFDYDMSNDHRYVLSQIVRKAREKKSDCIIIAGDVYDRTAPSEESVSILNDFLSDLHELGIPVCIISGNHDPEERLSFLRDIVAKQNIFFSKPYCGKVEKVSVKDADIYLLPYLRAIDVRRHFPDEDIPDINSALEKALSGLSPDGDRINIIVSHQYVSGAVLSGGEEMNIGGETPVSPALFDRFDYTALGHIHSSQRAGSERIRYSGSVLKCSVKERGERSFLYVTVDDDKTVTCEECVLEPLHDIVIKRGLFDDIIRESSDDYIYVKLLDRQLIPDAAKRLSDRFERFLSLEYVSESENSDEVSLFTGEEEHTPMEYLDELFRSVLSKELSGEQRACAEKLISEIWGNP
ncbi:MAG: exonuclease SbcCD subunit D, partial [Bullifex sp.]